MPWFLTSIAPKEDLVPPKRNLCRASRTFGFYTFYKEAFDAVFQNRGNMQECLYEYLVIEYIEPGIHPEVHIEEWYEWDKESSRWLMLVFKPKEFDGIVNWALG